MAEDLEQKTRKIPSVEVITEDHPIFSSDQLGDPVGGPKILSIIGATENEERSSIRGAATRKSPISEHNVLIGVIGEPRNVKHEGDMYKLFPIQYYAYRE